jgi:DNA excision repair protein ERCC-2
VPVQIDLERRRITASVRDLVGEDSQRAIGLGGTGLSRMWIGQELHRRLQNDLQASEAGYRIEVPVEHRISIDGWEVVLSGRADGVLFDGETPLRVDEIKTLHFAVDLHNLYQHERLERYRRQARLYAYILSSTGFDVAGRLLLVDIVSTEILEEELDWDATSVEAWLRQAVHRLVAVERRRLDRLEQLKEAAELLPFPHPEPREVQMRIGDAVSESLEQGRHLLVRAPTGCGKTAAVLHPALRTALSRGHRLFFLTAKTLQQRITVDTARAMQDGLFRSLQLRAKAKMCANSEIICHEEFCPYAREYGPKLVRTQLLQTLLESDDHQDPDQLFEAARDHEVCPFEVSLDLLPDVDLVVCDYNYVFDPNIGLAALLHGGALRDAVLVIDEAHNLVDRSREYYSPTIDTALLERARAFLDTRDNAVFRELKGLVGELAVVVAEIVSEALEDTERGDGAARFDRGVLADLRVAFDGAALSYFLYKREHDLWMAEDPVMDVFLSLTRFHRVLDLGGEEFVHLASRLEGGVEQIKIFCLDASRFVGALLEESAGVVAMSATLEPFSFYRNLLGFSDPRTDELHVPSPFPASNRLVLAIDDVDTTYRHRSGHYDRIASWIGRLAQRGCNVLTLFPSYQFLAAVEDRLEAPHHTVLIQEPGSSDASQRDFLDRLANGRSHLVLAVLGGIFAEGVDYPGEMLSQVIVVSPGLPQYNTERELLKAYYQECYGHGFGYAYLIPGLTRVVQAAGRLFRSDEDRGAIVLMCRRFLDPRYARLLPEEWIEDGDPTSLLSPDPELAIREFFREW